MNNSSSDLTDYLDNSCDSKIKPQSLQQSDLQKSKILKKNSLKIVGLSIVINTIIAVLLGYFYSISPISSKILFPVIAFSGLFMGSSGLYCLHRHIQYLNIKNSHSQESNQETTSKEIVNDSNLEKSSGLSDKSDPDRIQLKGHEKNGTIPLSATGPGQDIEHSQRLQIPSTFASPIAQDIKPCFRQSKIIFC